MTHPRVRLAMRAALVVAVFLAFLFSILAMWAVVDQPNNFFGGDHAAYRAGAARLVATGSPYHTDLLAGPIANRIENVSIGYLYPPVLAQLFVPLFNTPFPVLAWANVIIQAIVLLVALSLVYRRFAGRLVVEGLLFVALAMVASFPVNMALYGGNLSGWIAIAVAVMLISPGPAAGIAAATVALLKMTPVVLVVPALLYRPTRPATIWTLAVATAASVILAPSAWLAWLTVLPNILRFPAGESAANFAPVAVLSAFGFAGGAALGYAIAGSAAIASGVLAWRGRWPGAVAAGVCALLFASGSMWDHYLVPTLPLVVAAAATRTFAGYVVALAYIGMSEIMWFDTFSPPDALRLLYLVTTLLVSIELVLILTRTGARAVVSEQSPQLASAHAG